MDWVLIGVTGADRYHPNWSGTADRFNSKTWDGGFVTNRLDDFQEKRQKGNDRILGSGHLGIKRFMNLDTAAYRKGALDVQAKELLGLGASMVLRCNDCIDYHLERCVAENWSPAELEDATAVAMMVGGSIVIPHARHVAESMEFLLAEKDSS